VDEDEDKLVQSPLELIFGETRPPCNMLPGSPSPIALAEFRLIADHIGTRDLVQEFLAFRVFLTLKEWEMPMLEGKKKKGELVRLPYHFKFKKLFTVPCQEWLDTIEVMCNEILGNYSKKEDQLMTAAFGTRPKRRLNRVMDALGFEYLDYERLDKGAEGQNRKRVADVLNKDDEDQSKKKKPESEPKQVFRRREKLRLRSKKAIDEEEGTPATPSTTEVEEILKVMTESLPVKLSPLGPQLTKLFQKEKEPTKWRETARAKKQRIITVTEVIEKTPLGASAPNAPAAKSSITTKAAPSKATDAEATRAEDINLESTVADIDKILVDLAAEEAAGATEKASVPQPEKRKKLPKKHRKMKFSIFKT
jgi:hypothetical protein